MTYCKYKIRCSSCGADSFLVSIESNPIMYKCNGCHRFVIINKDQLFTVKEEFFIKMAHEYSIKCCGQVVACMSKSEYKSGEESFKKKEITEEDLKKLHDFLIKSKDSSDIIEKL